MYLNFEDYDNKLVVHMMGELDHHSAEEVRTKIDDRLDRNKNKLLILDFADVTFMDSSGIGVVIGRYKKLTIKGGNVFVTNVNSSIKKVFELSGMFKIIKLFDSLDKALEYS